MSSRKLLLIDVEQFNVILYNSIVILYMFNGIILQSFIAIEKIWMISRTIYCSCPEMKLKWKSI